MKNKYSSLLLIPIVLTIVLLSGCLYQHGNITTDKDFYGRAGKGQTKAIEITGVVSNPDDFSIIDESDTVEITVVLSHYAPGSGWRNVQDWQWDVYLSEGESHEFNIPWTYNRTHEGIYSIYLWATGKSIAGFEQDIDYLVIWKTEQNPTPPGHVRRALRAIDNAGRKIMEGDKSIRTYDAAKEEGYISGSEIVDLTSLGYGTMTADNAIELARNELRSAQSYSADSTHYFERGNYDDCLSSAKSSRDHAEIAKKIAESTLRQLD